MEEGGAEGHGRLREHRLSINALPLGGFVKIKGESEDGLQGRDSIHAKPTAASRLLVSHASARWRVNGREGGCWDSCKAVRGWYEIGAQSL